jgi:hypothetical protein
MQLATNARPDFGTLQPTVAAAERRQRYAGDIPVRSVARQVIESTLDVGNREGERQ